MWYICIVIELAYKVFVDHVLDGLYFLNFWLIYIVIKYHQALSLNSTHSSSTNFDEQSPSFKNFELNEVIELTSLKSTRFGSLNSNKPSFLKFKRAELS